MTEEWNLEEWAKEDLSENLPVEINVFIMVGRKEGFLKALEMVEAEIKEIIFPRNPAYEMIERVFSRLKEK